MTNKDRTIKPNKLQAASAGLFSLFLLVVVLIILVYVTEVWLPLHKHLSSYRVSASLPRQTSYLWKWQVCQRWHRNAFISVFGKGFGFKYNRYMLARCPPPPSIIAYIFQPFCSALLILRESLTFLKIQHSTDTVWTPENQLLTVPLWSQGGYKHTSLLIM